MIYVAIAVAIVRDTGETEVIAGPVAARQTGNSGASEVINAYEQMINDAECREKYSETALLVNSSERRHHQFPDLPAEVKSKKKSAELQAAIELKRKAKAALKVATKATKDAEKQLKAAEGVINPVEAAPKKAKTKKAAK